MTAAVNAGSAFASGDVALSFTTPPTSAAGDRAILTVAYRLPDYVPAEQDGWHRLAMVQSASGTAQGVGVGDLGAALFWKDLAAPLPTPTPFDMTGALAEIGILQVLRPTAGKVLTTLVAGTGHQDTATTTPNSTPPIRDLSVGDLVFEFLAASRGSSGFTATSGVITPQPTGRKTLSAITNGPGNSGGVVTTLGNDLSVYSARATVTASTGVTDSVKIQATRSVSTSGYGPHILFVQGEDFPPAAFSGFGLALV